MAIGTASSAAQPSTTKTRTGSRSTALTVALALLTLMVIVGLVVLITWLILRPKKPEIVIEKACIRGYNLTHSKLNSTFDFTIRVRNPNKRVSMYYGTMEESVSYQGQVAASQVMEPFYLGRKNETWVRVQAVARDVVLGGSIEQALKRERTGGAVSLSVVLHGKTKFKVRRWKSHHYKMKVKCAPLVVFSDPKRFKPTKCDVDI